MRRLTLGNVSRLRRWLLSCLSLRYLRIDRLSLRRNFPILAISLVEALRVLRLLRLSLLVRRLSALLLVKSTLSCSLIELICHLMVIRSSLGLILELLALSLL